MTIYRALQLNAAGSKDLIKNSLSNKERLKWSMVYLLKVVLTLSFCILFISAFSTVFGAENSITGVVVLLILLLVRGADFGINMRGSTLALFFLFFILAIGTHCANLLPAPLSFVMHLCCFFAITMLGCHNLIMSNQFTFILGYLLLYGYDVSGVVYISRLSALFVGFLLCCVVYWANHRKRYYKRGFLHLLKEFDLSSSRSQWQIRISLGTASAMLAASLLALPRIMWVGIACMSIMTPLIKDSGYREIRRLLFNIVGGLIFIMLYHLLPAEIRPYLGILGGIGVGFSATYSFQTIFNTLGALLIAVSLFGLYQAVLLRIAVNLFAVLYCHIFNIVWETVRRKATRNMYS